MSDFRLRPASDDDAGIVADLDAAINPDDPRDPLMLRWWWTTAPRGESFTRQVGERDGKAIAFVMAGHSPWEAGSKRFGSMRAFVHPDMRETPCFEQLIDTAESWFKGESAEIFIARVRASRIEEIALLNRRGYRKVRRTRRWELDLIGGRDRLLAGAKRTLPPMIEQGVQLHPLDKDSDPDVLVKLYRMATEAEGDVPTTEPFRKESFEEWVRFWFEGPGVRKDRFWIARDGAEVIGLSVLGYPPIRGVPWTAFTATARAVRGRGIAKALKYQSIAQAIELGVQRVRTNNDSENAPILHINQEMGYQPLDPIIELHRDTAG